MATKQSTTRARSARTTASPRGLHAAALDCGAARPVHASHVIFEALEAQRSRLMTAEAILDCVRLAMESELREDAHPPHFPTLIELARSLLAQSIDGLDSLRIKPLLEQLEPQARGEVREGVARYVH